MDTDVKIAIIGGGLGGLSSSYHLAENGIEKQIIIEAGKLGKGSDDIMSGTNGPIIPGHSKITTFTYPSDYDSFKNKLGKEKAKTYVEFSYAGREIQKEIARKLDPSSARELDTLIVGKGEDFEFLKREKEHYEEMGFNCFKPYPSSQIADMYKIDKKTFDGGFLLEGDAIIDPAQYIEALRRKVDENVVIIAEKTKVTGIREHKDCVEIETSSGEVITAEQAVIATNGFYQDENLKGLLDLWWNYIVRYENKGENTPSTWTLGNHWFYWTRQDNILMIGEGGGGKERRVNGSTASFYKEKEIIDQLKKWTNETFTHTSKKQPVTMHYGIDANTSDGLSIMGKIGRKIYCAVCNSNGQPAESLDSSLVPYILYPEEFKMSDQQKKFAELVSPRRKTLKQIV
ncbi:hypothetical protein COS75_03210 [Candidatus Pacearchaeota archaeon CG06_land_8_20_14_3_00_35_12]|nr:MAG: hypothetical protein COS75_03210 [Candidatus Pacearchaeota archaeon CG06_land_8_20_14_3_00_35_12]